MYLNLFHELIRFDRRHYLAKFGICELFSTTIPSTVLAHGHVVQLPGRPKSIVAPSYSIYVEYGMVFNVYTLILLEVPIQ